MGLLHLEEIPNADDAVSMAMVLPLLPNRHIAAGRKIVIRTFLRDAEEAASDRIQRFGRYLQGQWEGLNVSVFGESPQTRNAVESFHYALLKLVGMHHNSIWNFLEFLIKMENSRSCDITRLRQGGQLPQCSRSLNFQLDIIIRM